MIRVQADPNNMKTFLKFETLSHDIFYEIEKAFWEIGKLVTSKLSNNILRTKKSGVMYKYLGRRLRASAAGEYPRSRSGFLRNSINFQVKSPTKMEVGLSAEYAEYLQEGTKNIKKRKLLNEVVADTDQEQRNILEKRIDAGVKR